MGAFVVAALLVALLIWLYARNLDTAQRQVFFKRLPWYLLLGSMVVLAVTGRLNWLVAAFAALVPVLGRLLSLLRFVPVFAQLYKMLGGSAPAAGGGSAANDSDATSEVESHYLSMRLDHASGMMSGTIRRGTHQGRTLADLTRAQLLDLYTEYHRKDEESAALLAAYLDREHPDWRSTDYGDAEQGAGASNGFSGAMSRAEAAEILGVAEDADTDAIRAAHRRLMQKNHPDHGGSTFLAAKINEAKQRLLEDQR